MDAGTDPGSGPVRAEEFAGPAGAGPDPAVWVPEVGGGGWGDDQLQCYTPAPANAFITGSGQLALVARREAGAGTITSARLTTHDRVHVRYGRVEARIKVPPGPGVWPAFWMLGADIDRVGWPACGEIDVMEYVGSEPRAVHGTVHGPGYAGVGRGIGRAHEVSVDLAEDFHVYGVEWAEDHISWPGTSADGLALPATMLVDWIRVHGGQVRTATAGRRRL